MCGFGGTARQAASRRARSAATKPNILGGAHGDWLIERTDTDFTLRGLVAELGARGVKVDYVQVWRFVHARGLSFKKKCSSRRTAAPEDRQAARAVEEVSGAA